jgi:hypothetical protein
LHFANHAARLHDGSGPASSVVASDQQTTSGMPAWRRTKARPSANTPTRAGINGAGEGLAAGAAATTARCTCGSHGPALSKQAVGWRAGSAIITVAAAGAATNAAAMINNPAAAARILPPHLLQCDITQVDDRLMKPNWLHKSVSTTCGHEFVTPHQFHHWNHAGSYAGASIRDAAHIGI